MTLINVFYGVIETVYPFTIKKSPRTDKTGLLRHCLIVIQRDINPENIFIIKRYQSFIGQIERAAHGYHLRIAIPNICLDKCIPNDILTLPNNHQNMTAIQR